MRCMLGEGDTPHTSLINFEWGMCRSPLFFTVYEVVVILHADEFMPAVRLGDVLQHLELARRH